MGSKQLQKTDRKPDAVRQQGNFKEKEERNINKMFPKSTTTGLLWGYGSLF